MLSNVQKNIIDNALNGKGIVFKKGKFYQGKQTREVAEVVDKIADVWKAVNLPYEDVKDYLAEQVQAYCEVTEKAGFASVDDAIKAFVKDVIQPKYNINSNFTHITNKYGNIPLELNLDAIKHELTVWREEHCQEYSISALQSGLALFINYIREHAAEAVYKKIAYDPASVDEGRECLSELYQIWQIKEKYEIFETLMKHWIWLVKRKLLAKPVKWHLWINFSGGTGIGKSETLRIFCKNTFEDFYNETTISKLFDDTREIKRLTTKYILNMDELAVNVNGLEDDGHVKADQKALLKSILTADKLDTRVYGTQEQATNRITFTCISSSNNHLYDVVFDDTSMRRFFEFNCGLKIGSRAIFDRMNEQIFPKFEALWKSVDENLDDGYWNPYSDVGREIDNIQKGYYPTKTTVVEWMKEMHITITTKKTDQKAVDWYKMYEQWCRECGFTKPKSRLRYMDELRRRSGDTGCKTLYLQVGIVPTNKEASKLDSSTVSDLTEAVGLI